MRRSVLDDLGEEVTGIVAPVSLCMALTVALVRILNPEGDSDSNAVFLASAYYTESEGDTAGQKLSGSIINALIFVGVVAVMTFVLVLLFKYGCVRVIYAYMGLAGFSIFFVLTGIIALELLQKWHVHLDFISFTYILFNFAVVGSVTLFFFPAPLLMKQSYLIITGIVTAYVFTWIPEWTTWVLLVAMAIYDVLAVLVPGGPLKMLVELAQEREETIPALVYEARPVRRDNPAVADAQLRPEPATALGDDAAVVAPAGQRMAVGQRQQELPVRAWGALDAGQLSSPQQQQQQQQQGRQAGSGIAALSIERVSATSSDSTGGSSSGSEAPDTPLIPSLTNSLQQQQVQLSASSAGTARLSGSSAGTARPRSTPPRPPISEEIEVGDVTMVPSRHSAPSTMAQLQAMAGPLQQPAPQPPQQQQQSQRSEVQGHHTGGGDSEADDAAFILPDSIKLGLGDFIFYSMLVGRAAMYDFLTVFACYLAIIAGLGCTLLWLAMARKALPALPISIALAVCFYFISRFVMEPVILPMTLQLVFF